MFLCIKFYLLYISYIIHEIYAATLEDMKFNFCT